MARLEIQERFLILWYLNFKLTVLHKAHSLAAVLFYKQGIGIQKEADTKIQFIFSLNQL